MHRSVGTRQLLAAAAAALLPGALPHGAMIMPLARNSIDAELAPWRDGKQPPLGTIDPIGCPGCTNGTQPCALGQGCYWFSQGCNIGCSRCTTNGSRIPNWDQCPAEREAGTALRRGTLLRKYWSTNQNATEGSPQDIWKWNPWRAPGRAPVSDPCGMAGGSPIEKYNGAMYNTTTHTGADGQTYTLAQGMLGSVALRPRPSGAVWRAGSRVKARWEQTAAHGGGYIYRLCRADEKISEECFDRLPLRFATEEHTVVYRGGQTEQIAATIVKEGGGLGWARNPLPWVSDAACDYRVPHGEHCTGWPGKEHCPGCGPTPSDPGKPWTAHAADNACPTSCARFPEFWNGPLTGSCMGDLLPPPVNGSEDRVDGMRPCADPRKSPDAIIEDTLLVPPAIRPGEYVLNWRWDCEATSQVWQSCSDVTIE